MPGVLRSHVGVGKLSLDLSIPLRLKKLEEIVIQFLNLAIGKIRNNIC